MNWIICLEVSAYIILGYLAFRNFYTYKAIKNANKKVAVYQHMLLDLGIYLPEFPYYEMMIRPYTEYLFDFFEFKKDNVIKPHFRSLIAELEKTRYYEYYSKEIDKKIR